MLGFWMRCDDPVLGLKLAVLGEELRIVHASPEPIWRRRTEYCNELKQDGSRHEKPGRGERRGRSALEQYCAT